MKCGQWTPGGDDFVELYNYSAAAVDLSGCSVSDDRVISRNTLFPPRRAFPRVVSFCCRRPRLALGSKRAATP